MAEKSGSVDPSKYPDEVFDLYSIPAFDSGKPEVRAGNEIGSTKQVVQPGDVLLSRIVPHIRRSWVVGENDGKRLIASGEWIVFRSPQINPRYLSYFLVGDPFHSRFMQTVSGVGGSLLRAKSSEVAKIQIPVPPLEEQDRIIKLLEEADEVRKLRSQADRRAADFIPALFHDMFGDSTSMSKRWPPKVLGEITRIDAPMVDPRLEEYLDLPHIGPERIEGQTGRLLAYKTAREDALVSGKFLFDRSHVLYSKIRPYLRKAAIPHFRGLCSADVYPVRPVQSDICREYLWAILISESFTKYTAGLGERANIPKVNREQLNAYPCPLPPLALQKEFASRMTEIRELEAEQAACRERLDALFQSMLHRAFRGEL
jgi:type I restriction enzyme S subunit